MEIESFGGHVLFATERRLSRQAQTLEVIPINGVAGRVVLTRLSPAQLTRVFQ